jgi:citrate/tricarballylate utilization protein
MRNDEVVLEATRQMNICNSCRYCAGYCSVWPALERRTNLQEADVVHLANLCHDCRDCYFACMYTEPHEFGLNPPKVFAELRERSYQDYTWPGRLFVGKTATITTILLTIIATAVLVWFAYLTDAFANFFVAAEGDPYSIIRKELMILSAIVPSTWAIIVTVRGMFLYWRDIHGKWGDLFNVRAWLETLGQVATLKHQTGGAEGCHYEEPAPTSKRRYLHQMVMYGFLLTFVATSSAAFMENFLDLHPPYPYLSVPVVSGTVGGILQVAGVAGLIWMKGKADPELTTSTMKAADYWLLITLGILNFTGLLVLVFRTTEAFGALLVLHLIPVIVFFMVAPYTKFVHWVYRVLSMQKDTLERMAEGAGKKPHLLPIIRVTSGGAPAGSGPTNGRLDTLATK